MADEQTLLTQGATPEAPAEAVADAPVTADASAPAQDAPDWRPESLRGEKWLEKYKTPEDALKGFAEAQKMLGKRAEGLVPPDENSTPEQVEAFNAKLRELRGVPAAEKVAEAYAVTPPADAPEGYELSPELVGAFQELAFKAGIAPAEFKELADGYMQMEVASIVKLRQDMKAEQAKAEAALVKEWRADGRVPKVELENALKAAKFLGIADLLGNYGNRTELVNRLATDVYPLIKEGGLHGGGKDTGQPVLSPKEAFAKLRIMQADPRYRDPAKRDPDYVREIEVFVTQNGDSLSKLTSPA